jgi:hypothetical protein
MAVSFTPLPGDMFDQAKPDQKNGDQGQNNGPCIERKPSYWCLVTHFLVTHFFILCFSRALTAAGWCCAQKEKPTHVR